MAENNSPRNCQSCERTDAAEKEMVQCDQCKLWEHFGCAGVDQRIRQPDVKYICPRCTMQGRSGEANLKVPVVKPRSSKGSKTSSKAGSRKGKKNPDPAESVTSSVRAALLEEQLKLVEEEQKMQEQALLEEGEIKRRLLEEEERQLEEAKRLRERKLQEELEFKRKQQQVRQESFEKRQDILRQLAAASSRGGSIVNSDEKVKDWLDGQDAGRPDGNKLGQTNTPNLDQIPEDPADHSIPPLPSIPQNQTPLPSSYAPIPQDLPVQLPPPPATVPAPQGLPVPLPKP